MGLHDGRVAIVTGAAQGIGLAVATRLLGEGARVLLADVQAEKVAAAAARLDPSGKTAKAHAFDASASDAAKTMVAAAEVAFGGLDVLANVAGGSGVQRVECIDDMPDEVWDRIMANNLRSTFVCSRAAVPLLRKRGGHIVNFATGSIRGFTGKTTSSAPLAYVAAKAGIIGFTNQLSADLKPANIAVSVIQPGFVLTEPGARIHDLFNKMTKEEQAAMLGRRTPRTPENLGLAVTFVASRPVEEVSAMSIRLVGPIDKLDLRVVRDPEGQLASTGWVEAN